MSDLGFVLKHGKHATQEEGMCLLEATAFLAGERHTDRPACACPVLAAYGRRLNDAWWPSDDARTEAMSGIAQMLVGTRAAWPVERRRMFSMVDGTVRRILPMAFDAIGLPDESAKLRALPPVDDSSSARIARDACRAARGKAWGRWAAAAASTAIAEAAATAATNAAAIYAAAAADAAAAIYAAADARLRVLREAASILREACAITEAA